MGARRVVMVECVRVVLYIGRGSAYRIRRKGSMPKSHRYSLKIYGMPLALLYPVLNDVVTRTGQDPRV